VLGGRGNGWSCVRVSAKKFLEVYEGRETGAGSFVGCCEAEPPSNEDSAGVREGAGPPKAHKRLTMHTKLQLRRVSPASKAPDRRRRPPRSGWAGLRGDLHSSCTPSSNSAFQQQVLSASSVIGRAPVVEPCPPAKAGLVQSQARAGAVPPVVCPAPQTPPPRSRPVAPLCVRHVHKLLFSNNLDKPSRAPTLISPGGVPHASRQRGGALRPRRSLARWLWVIAAPHRDCISGPSGAQPRQPRPSCGLWGLRACMPWTVQARSGAPASAKASSPLASAWRSPAACWRPGGRSKGDSQDGRALVGRDGGVTRAALGHRDERAAKPAFPRESPILAGRTRKPVGRFSPSCIGRPRPRSNDACLCGGRVKGQGKLA
jgi:hypothetical protein